MDTILCTWPQIENILKSTKFGENISFHSKAIAFSVKVAIPSANVFACSHGYKLEVKKKKKKIDNYSSKESKQMSYTGFILVEEET